MQHKNSFGRTILLPYYFSSRDHSLEVNKYSEHRSVKTVLRKALK